MKNLCSLFGISVLLLSLFTSGCKLIDESSTGSLVLASEMSSGLCKDEAYLLASTVGSPDVAVCPNVQQVMQVQVVSAGTEEVGVAVVCKCTRITPFWRPAKTSFVSPSTQGGS